MYSLYFLQCVLHYNAFLFFYVLILVVLSAPSHTLKKPKAMDDTLLKLFSQMPFIAALLAGILSFLSPCVLPLIPAYMAYISNQSLQDLKTQNPSIKGILPYTILFVLGFMIVFLLLGAGMARLIDTIAPAWIKQASGIIILLFGFHFLGIFRLKILYKNIHFHLGKNTRFHQLLTPFVLGISFALGWTPCIGPIFASIILLASSNGGYGFSLMLVFSLGLSIPFILCALVFTKALKAIAFLKAHARKIEVISGILLILLGIGILGGFLDSLAS